MTKTMEEQIEHLEWLISMEKTDIKNCERDLNVLEKQIENARLQLHRYEGILKHLTQ